MAGLVLLLCGLGAEARAAPVAAPGDPQEETPATTPTSGPPKGWTSRGASGAGEPRSAPGWGGARLQLGVMGGALVSGGVALGSDSGWGLDLSVGPRVGIGSDLYLNLAGLAGLSYTAGQRTRHGVFLRAGATLPLEQWTEGLAAMGYTLQAPFGQDDWLGFDLGFGAMLYQTLPGGYEPWPGLFYLRATMAFSLAPERPG